MIQVYTSSPLLCSCNLINGKRIKLFLKVDKCEVNKQWKEQFDHAATLLGSKLTVTIQEMDLGIIVDSAIQISDLSVRAVKKQTNC